MDYHVGLKTGEEILPGFYQSSETVNPHAEKIKRSIWQMKGPLDKGYALNALQKLTKAHGQTNVQLFVAVPWYAAISVQFDCTVRFVYPKDVSEDDGDDEEEGEVK